MSIVSQGGEKMYRKIFSILIIVILLFSLTVTPSNIQASPVDLDVLNVEVGGESFIISEKLSTDTKKILEIQGESTTDIVTVFYKTGDFTITSEDGSVKSFNIKDFESAENPEYAPMIPEEIETGEKYLLENTQLPGYPSTFARDDPHRKYLGDINKSLGFDNSATWNRESSYIHGGLYVDVYRGTYWTYTEVLKKYTFSASTAISVILGVIVAVAGYGFTAAAVISILQGLGITVISEKIAYAISPSIGVKQKQVGRGFDVRGHGFTLSTKNWTNYLEVVHQGKIKLESYSSDQYNFWYNNYSNQNVAEVAYQQYRYIEGLRNTAPYGAEFSWRY